MNGRKPGVLTSQLGGSAETDMEALRDRMRHA